MASPFREQFLVFCNISTTSDEHQVCVTKESAEIIKIEWSIVRSKDFVLKKKQSVLIRPVKTPITDLCTGTNGLTWSDVEGAGSLVEALETFATSLQDEVLVSESTYALIVYDMSDLRLQLSRESQDKGLTLPEFLQYPRFYELRDEYSKWQRNHPQTHAYGPPSLFNTCAALSIEAPARYTGQPLDSRTSDLSASTEGFDDVDVCLKIVKALIASQVPPDSLFAFAQDLGLDYRAFVKQNSKVLHLTGLASDTTQSELESWFTQHGGRPIAFWTLRTPDPQKPTGTGFAVFPSHDDAAKSLDMNGRILAGRTILVSPSSPLIMDRAAGILSPFPPSKNRPRPGDWTCPSCGFSNFQRRTACFRCSYPSNNAVDPYYPMHSSINNMSTYPPTGAYPPNPSLHGVPMRPMTGGGGAGGGGHVPFRAGDWSCSTCAYHNFARNSVCLKCSMPRTQQPDLSMMNNYNDYGVGVGGTGVNASYNMTGITDDMARQML